MHKSLVRDENTDLLKDPLEQSEERFRNIFEKPKAIMMFIDPETGDILDANTAAADFYGWPAEKLRTMKVKDINLLSETEIAAELKAAVNEQRNYFVFRHRRSGGRECVVEVYSSPLIIEGKQRLLSIIHDITDRKKTEDQLRKLSSAVEHSPDSIIITDYKGNIEYANPEFTRITGYTPEEVLGKNPRIFKSGKTDPALYKDLWETILSGKKWQGAFENRKKSGELYWESVNIAPVFDPAGIITHFVAVKEDITRQKKHGEQLSRLNRTLHALRRISNAVHSADDEKSFMQEVCNIVTEDCGHLLVWIGFALQDEGQTVEPVAYAGFEKSFIESLNITWADTVPGRGPTGTAIRTGKPSFCADTKTDSRFKPWRDEAVKRGASSSIALPLKIDKETMGALSIYSKDSDSFPPEEIELLTELADDLAYGISVIRLKKAHDIKAAEVADANNQLRMEIEKEKQVELLLKESLDKEKELNELKSSFISTTSHEFRTPLTSILSSMQLIQRYRQKWSDDRIEEQFGKIKDSVFNLTRLLDDILTISHADSGRIIFNPQEIDLHAFFLQIMEEIRHMASPAHKFNYEYEAERKKYCLDAKLIRFIMLNLLSNAFKYSPEGGRIKLMISSTPEYLQFSVSDEGIGIPKKDMDDLFKPFFRAGNTGEIEGTGLGLSIVRRAVDMHNGTIKCQSEIGNGTEFEVRIPW